MDITGTWYWNPGDIPTEFAIPVILHEDGRAEWLGGGFGVLAWRAEQDKLVIGETNALHMVFALPEAKAEHIAGEIRSPYEPDQEELEDMTEEERAGPHFFGDAAALLRDPGELEIQLDAEPRAPEPASTRH